MAESFGVFGMACFARAAAFPAPFIFAYKMATSRDDKKTLVNTRPHTGEPDLRPGPFEQQEPGQPQASRLVRPIVWKSNLT